MSFNSLQTGTHSQTALFAYTNSDLSLFQFPSNGNAQSDLTRKRIWQILNLSFNSLQTGTHSQTKAPTTPEAPEAPKVSIPFKRERTVRRTAMNLQSMRQHVSIPFKRERTVRLTTCFFLMGYLLMFQFPSNGNAQSDRPHFRPTGAVASERQNQTRSAQAFFSLKNYLKKPANPRAH